MGRWLEEVRPWGTSSVFRSCDGLAGIGNSPGGELSIVCRSGQDYHWWVRSRNARRRSPNCPPAWLVSLCRRSDRRPAALSTLLRRILGPLLTGLCVVPAARPALSEHRTGDSGSAEQEADAVAFPRRLPAASLENVIGVHPRVVSGSVPVGHAGFAELRSLGIRTVISVDGVKPDVATAHEYGLRYVHLPHGYDGILPTRIAELAKAVGALPGPVYIHCHHGKHRSPAAAGAACRALGWIDHASAQGVLALAGTSPHYAGLREAVATTRPLSSESLDKLRVDFQETVDLPEMVESMVAIDRTHEGLRQIAEARWQPPTDHPDLDPQHEALMLREQLVELLRGPAVRTESPAFRQMLARSADAAAELESAVAAAADTTGSRTPRNDLDHHLARVTTSCTDCHRKFRDQQKVRSENSADVR